MKIPKGKWISFLEGLAEILQDDDNEYKNMDEKAWLDLTSDNWRNSPMFEDLKEEIEGKGKPKYGSGDIVNIEVEIREAIVKTDKDGKAEISYNVKPSNVETSLNTMIIKEEKIQD